MPGGISHLARSWRLMKAGWDVLRADGELLVLPALSGVATIVLGVAFIGLAFRADIFAELEGGMTELPLSFYAALFLFYVVQYFVIFFFNTALVGAALQRLDGGNPTLGSALNVAASRIGAILGYAVISATVGMVLRIVSERLGIIGRFIEAGAGLAWTVTTFLVVPVLAHEGLGPLAAIGRSGALLRKTWGENLIGTAGISLVLSVAGVIVVVAGVGGGIVLNDAGFAALAPMLIGAAVAIFLFVMIVGSALSGIYAAAVYYYAVVGEPPFGFEPGLIEGAFAKKKA